MRLNSAAPKLPCPMLFGIISLSDSPTGIVTDTLEFSLSLPLYAVCKACQSGFICRNVLTCQKLGKFRFVLSPLSFSSIFLMLLGAPHLIGWASLLFVCYGMNGLCLVSYVPLLVHL